MKSGNPVSRVSEIVLGRVRSIIPYQFAGVALLFWYVLRIFMALGDA